jgi:hypothetical protein
MFATIRKYRTTQAGLITQKVNEGFLSVISEAPGFIAYYGIDTGNGEWASFSIFETEEQARQSTADAATWVKENVALLMDGPPEVTAGRLVVRREPGKINDPGR